MKTDSGEADSHRTDLPDSEPNEKSIREFAVFLTPTPKPSRENG